MNLWEGLESFPVVDLSVLDQVSDQKRGKSPRLHFSNKRETERHVVKPVSGWGAASIP